MHTTRPFHNHFHKAISVICYSLTINCKLIFLVNIVTALHDGCFILMWVRPIHKQLSRGLLRKRCSENIQQIYRRTPIMKCDYNKVAMRLCCSQKFSTRFFTSFSVVGTCIYFVAKNFEIAWVTLQMILEHLIYQFQMHLLLFSIFLQLISNTRQKLLTFLQILVCEIVRFVSECMVVTLHTKYKLNVLRF